VALEEAVGHATGALAGQAQAVTRADTARALRWQPPGPLPAPSPAAALLPAYEDGGPGGSSSQLTGVIVPVDQSGRKMA